MKPTNTNTDKEFLTYSPECNPFGRYSLVSLNKRLLYFSQKMPRSWLGRRVALILRKLVLKGRILPIDAEVEGLRIRAHTHDNVSERKFLFMPRFCDPAERDYVESHLTPNGVFLDIGANAGLYTLTAARNYARMGGKGLALAVEANPTMQARLQFNIALNNFESHVRLAPIALSAQTGEVVFTIADGNLGESGLNTDGGKKLKVPCKTLVDLLNDEDVRQVDGMKIDVEGMEDVILVPFFNEAPESIYPKFIVIEDSRAIWKEDLLGLLKGRGYELHTQHKMNLILTRDK